MSWLLKENRGLRREQQNRGELQTMRQSKMMKWRGWKTTLARCNENTELELLRTWELLDGSKPTRHRAGSSAHGLLLDGD